MPSIQDEVDRNYEEFMKLLPTILRDHINKYALMKDHRIIGYFSTAEDAVNAGTAAFADGLFSVQHVSDAVINLGYFNYAVPLSTVQP